MPETKSSKEQPGKLPELVFKDMSAWTAWLEKNHSKSPGVWLKLGRKGSSIQTVTYPQAIEAAICFGWIDGHKRPYDKSCWLQKFTPRGPKSIWSKINREKAEVLIESGRMKPAGLKAIESAKVNGRWDSAYDSQRTAAVPEDLQAALDASPKARTFYATLDSANRYAILFRLQTARKAETREKRIRQFIAMLERHEKLHP